MNKFNFLPLLAILVVGFSANAETLQIQKENNDFYTQLDNIVQEVKPRTSTKWSLSKLSLNTSKTHEGLFGLMPFKGTATATLSWIPKTVKANLQSIDEASDIQTFNLRSSEADVSYTASVWYREFLRAKKLPWNSNNEKAFINLFLQARSIAQQIANIQHPTWYIDQFVVERGLSVKGTLAPLLTAEAAFAVRFAFDLKSVKPSAINSPSELTALILGLAEDLSTSSQGFNLPSWNVDGFSLGLGISPMFGVGVVNAKPHAFAHMLFKARKKPALMNLPLRQQISVLTSENMKMFDYSKAGISNLASGEKTYIINRDKFRKGLAYGLSLAKKMTLQADKGDSSQKKWRLGQVVYRYETGVQGDLLFAGLKGHVGAEVALKKNLTAVQEIPSATFDLADITTHSADLQKALKFELQENKTVLNLVPAGQTLSSVESSASLKFSWGLDSPIADLKISAVPQVRLKFEAAK